MQEQGKNNGTLEGIKRTLETIGEEISNLNTAWAIIHNAHSDWPEDAGSLCDMQEKIDKVAEDAGLALTKYNKLVKQVESLRIAKEKAEKDEREYQDRATKLVKLAETKVTDANTLFSTEKGKTKNLQEQLNDRTAALESATAVLNKAKEEVRVKESELKAEIGDKNPDIYEKTLSQTKEQAEKAVKEQNKFIAGQYENLKELQGKEKTTKEYRETENERMTTARKALEQWIDAYNNKEDKLQVLTVDDIARFYSATDDWESMRARQKQLNEECTAAYTMWRNSQEVYGEHQNKKPKQSKEELAADLKTLENRSSDELVDIKARIQRHDQAKSQMGALFEQKQKAELLKNEWGQITSAIGPDGKTLRKIAQCYTLRFLIEHANAEIRKFNNRYELQQVKNSLGIRVIDHDRADDVRDITSLSGGETFIVSLGLALGLSSLSSRNLSFSNLFIDEGFGTLDPDTLATVIDSLAMLQTSQGKKVGVISHTDTMSERITTQIRIIKNGNSGSSHIEIHA